MHVMIKIFFKLSSRIHRRNR